MKVLYTAAHSGFNLGQIPLGGGASICQHLTDVWRRTRPFDLDVLGPSLLKESAPQHHDLVRYSEVEYARFCQQFERALSDTILGQNPKETVVLANDVSEGPDFRTLAAKGYSLYTIYHVDVVDYFTAIYLRSWFKPEQTTAFFRGISRLGLTRALPGISKLVWDKQEASVLYSKGLIVPSRRMKDVLLRSYPALEPSRVHVLPWGMWDEDNFSPADVQNEKESLKRQHPVPDGARTLLTLSRISPEKGQDRILKALALYEKDPDFPQAGVDLFIAGEPAYMMGKKYESRLRRLAATLKRTRVHFIGYVSGARKKAIFDLAEVYVFPSRHESYGLTLLEALRAGKPVLTTPSHGTREVFQPAFGEMIPEAGEARVPALLLVSLKRLLSNAPVLHVMSRAASDWAVRQRFTDTAGALAELLLHDH